MATNNMFSAENNKYFLDSFTDVMKFPEPLKISNVISEFKSMMDVATESCLASMIPADGLTIRRGYFIDDGFERYTYSFSCPWHPDVVLSYEPDDELEIAPDQLMLMCSIFGLGIRPSDTAAPITPELIANNASTLTHKVTEIINLIDVFFEMRGCGEYTFNKPHLQSVVVNGE